MSERLTRAQQQARTRERLLDSAETLFGERGIHRTSLDEIARGAGLTKGAVYANFANKKELISAIVERKLAGDDAPQRPLRSTADWVFALGDSWETNVDRPEVRRFAMAFFELFLYATRDPAEREPLAEWLRAVRAYHAQDARDAGLAGDPQTTASLLMALDIGVGLLHIADPEGVPASVYTAGVEALLRPRG